MAVLPDSSAGIAAALEWKTYRVRRRDKAALLKFIPDGLTVRGCRILSATDPGQAPFYIVFETPAGERHAVLAYAFQAGAKETGGRPPDEHRFQIKYGSELRGVLEVAVDHSCLVTTIFVGIDLERRVFVAADPLMNAPSPMSRSVEFKAHHVAEILRQGWLAWERDRRAPKTRTRPTPEMDEDARIQVLVGGTQDRVHDLIVLERLALGLDPGERHLIADRLAKQPDRSRIASASHRLLQELRLEPDALFDLIDGAARLKMAVRGWVAEQHLEEALTRVPGVTDCRRLEGEGQPDLTLRWKGSDPILIECKNVMRKPDGQGRARVDFQRTRAAKSDPCSRYYTSSEFRVLAACLHARTEEWEFRYALTEELPPHLHCLGRISNNLRVTEDIFTHDASMALDRCIS
jgi:hypothetical protein